MLSLVINLILINLLKVLIFTADCYNFRPPMRIQKLSVKRDITSKGVVSAANSNGEQSLGTSVAAPPVLQLNPEPTAEEEQKPGGFFGGLSSFFTPIFGASDAVNERIEQSDDTKEGVGGLYDYLTSPGTDTGTPDEGAEDGGSMFGWLGKPFGYLSGVGKTVEGAKEGGIGGKSKMAGGLSDIASKVSDDAGLDKATGLPLKDTFGLLKGGAAMAGGAGKMNEYYEGKQDAEELKLKLGDEGDNFYTKGAIDKNFVNEGAWGEGMEQMALGGVDVLSTLTGGVGGGAMKAGKAAYESGIASWLFRGIGSYLAPDSIDSSKKHEKGEKEQAARDKIAKNYLLKREILLGSPNNVAEIYKSAPEDSPVRKLIRKELGTINNLKNREEISNKKKIKELLADEFKKEADKKQAARELAK
jgi:hypothetical protein